MNDRINIILTYICFVLLILAFCFRFRTTIRKNREFEPIQKITVTDDPTKSFKIVKKYRVGSRYETYPSLFW